MISLPNSYSAKVEAFLEVADKRLRIGRIRDGVMMLRDTIDVPPATQGRVVMSVDGIEDTTSVVLINGITVQSATVEYRENAGGDSAS